MKGRISLSKILIAGHSSEMGLYEVLWLAGFPGFKMGIMSAVFHIAGMLPRLIERLNSLVRKEIPRVPRCFRWMAAGP